MDNLNKQFLLAVEAQDIELTSKLLNLGADVYTQDNEAIKIAATKGNIKLCRLLLHHGEEINAKFK